MSTNHIPDAGKMVAHFRELKEGDIILSSDEYNGPDGWRKVKDGDNDALPNERCAGTKFRPGVHWPMRRTGQSQHANAGLRTSGLGNCQWVQVEKGEPFYELRIDGKFYGCVVRETWGWVWYPEDEPERPGGARRKGLKTLKEAKRDGVAHAR